jgi:hypothetical protein
MRLLLQKRWLLSLVAAMLFLGSGHGPGVTAGYAQGAGLPAIDRYAVSVLAESGTVYAEGVAGAAPLNSTVFVTNLNTGASSQVAAQSDGSFFVSVPGVRGHQLRVVAEDQQGAYSAPLDLYASALTIKNPYASSGYWHVGQGHSHTTESDGIDSAAAVEAAYFDRGYDFIVSTDHYGWPVPYFVDPDDGMTPNPSNASTGKDLLWIRGSEIGNSAVHIGAWGTMTQLALGEIQDSQAAIDAIRNRGGIAVLNHPENEHHAWDWYDHILPSRRLSLVEAFNANGRRPDNESGANHSVDAVDLADDFQQVWWIGTDDCHDIAGPTFDQYAMVVQTDSANMTVSDLLGAADSGRIYIRESAAGPAISSVQVLGNTIVVSIADGPSDYEVTWKQRGNVIVGQDEAVNTQSSYTATGREGYVRAEVRRLSDGKRAYTQPLFIGPGFPDLSASASHPALVDNNASTVWDSGAPYGSFVVDAGSIRALNAIHIDWDGTDGRRFNYRVETSTTGAFGGEQVDVLRATWSNRSADTVDFFDQQTRYLRVIITGMSAGPPGSSVRVREVELLAANPARTNLYVNNQFGDDAGGGLIDSPWRTIAHGVKKVRPRDVLNLVNTGVPYTEPVDLGPQVSGKHPRAIIEVRGDPVVLTKINAAGLSFGARLSGTSNTQIGYLDVHSAMDWNIWANGTGAGTVIRNSRMHAGDNHGFIGSGQFQLLQNLVYGNAGLGVLAYVDGTQATIYHNVIDGNAGGGLSLNASDNISGEVRNNIVVSSSGLALARGSAGSLADSHNCVSGSYGGAWARTGSIDGNPQFLNAAAGNYQLSGSSPCIDAGIDVNIANDFAGNLIYDEPTVPNTGSRGNYLRNYVDIGAFEYNAPCADCPSCH